jgi:hypothetical protein
MPYRSLAQQRFLESDKSPLSDKQKEEWRKATNFKDLPEHVADKKKKAAKKQPAHKSALGIGVSPHKR